MPDLLITGASRGIGAALARACATLPDTRLLLVARDGARLEAMAAEVRALGGRAETVVGDLGSSAGATRLGETLAARIGPGTTLVHNAGLWPTALERNAEGYELAFMANHVGPLRMQAPLLASGKVARLMGVSAGLIVAGRFDGARTPRGDDFSPFRTYCSTKLAFALALRDTAAAHPELDVLVLHPGVVNTDLGVPQGLLGRLVRLVKRRWETPERCAARLRAALEEPQRWSPPGEARWRMEEKEQPWPASAEVAATRTAVRELTPALLAG